MRGKKKLKDHPWGVWVNSLDVWLEGEGREPVTYRTRRDAMKDCNEFNNAWKGRKHTYEPRKF